VQGPATTQPVGETLEIPGHIEQAVGAAVARQLETELGDRGLLLRADDLASASIEAARRGRDLLPRIIARCYPSESEGGMGLTVEFDDEHAAARIETALAFGAAAAGALGRCERGVGPSAGSIELICAIFNLGIGLVDSLCDADSATGEALLTLVQGQDLAAASEAPRERGWLRAEAPAAPALADDPAAAFTVEIIESFFELLHESYPDETWLTLRRAVGAQLCAALAAERQTVVRSPDAITRDQLIECSRLTSVLPFQIIETLACGADTAQEPSAGTRLGEAMWRIDDLVDLCDDARSGSLNGVLLAATPTDGHPGERDSLAALERLLASEAIACAAAEAAEWLLAGLRLGGNTDDQPLFLHFVLRYTGITPA
jgi:hypothetical protein